MTRVIAGTAGGRRLAVPPGGGTRPTSDRAREGLFGTVHALAGPLDGMGVLDLYAGSGAVGLEALSRGAARACLVEADPRALRVIRANVTALGLPGAEVVAGRVEAVLAQGPGGRPAAGLVFADPPYAMPGEEITGMLRMLAQASWITPDALLVVERSTRSGPVQWPAGYELDRSRRYGEATLWYGLASGAVPA